MNGEHEQLISEEDEELKRLREKKLKKLIEGKETRKEMGTEPVHVTDLNFDEIIKKHPLVLIDFWAPWCGPCRALAPTIEELAKEYAEKVIIGKLNVDENPNMAERFQVFSVPTLIMMKDECEIDRIVGLCPKKHIDAVLKRHVG